MPPPALGRAVPDRPTFNQFSANHLTPLTRPSKLTLIFKLTIRTCNKLADVIQDSGSLLRKAISRISTEYRLQFAWPQGHNSRADAQQQKDSSLPKKSLSMGAIKPSAQPAVHKKRNELDTKDGNTFR